MKTRERVLMCLRTMGVLIASVAPVWAQTDAIVRGQVLAAADGSALPQAQVTLTSTATATSLQTMTDAEGRFVFPQVPPAEYIVAAALQGFTRTETRVSVEPREVSRVFLRLDVAPVALEVNVAADATTLASTHSPSSSVITRERLDSVPPLQRMNLPDAIVTSAPGMIRGHDDLVHVRGHEIALNPLVNGVAFWENSHATFSAGLSPGMIESANVMTGGFPAEYGNRFGGVIDVVTKSGLRTNQRGSFTVTFGDEGRRNAEGEIGGRRGAFGYYVFGTVLASDRFFSPPSPEAIHDEASGGHAFVRLDRAPGERGAFNAVFMADVVDSEIPVTPLDVELRPAAEAGQQTRQQSAIVGWTRAWSNTVINASAYERWSKLRLLPAEGPLTAHARVTREVLTLGGKADAARLTGRHTIKAGLEAVALRPDEDLFYDYSGYRTFTHLVEWPHIHITAPVEFSGRETGGQLGAFVQDSLQLGDRTTLDAGVRLDHYSLVTSETHLSPRLNVAIRTGGGSVLHASYNHFFVPPAIEGVISSSAGLTSSIREIGVALPALTATTEDQFEAGASVPWGPLQLALTGYYRATDNPVHTTVWPDSRIYSYASFDEASAYGLEAKVEIPGASRLGVTGFLNYAFGRVEFSNPVTGGFITEADHLTDSNWFPAPMDQTHTLTGGATYRHSRSGVWGGVLVEYGSGTPIGHGGSEHADAASEAVHEHADAETAERVPGHFIGNLSFGVDVWRRADKRPRLTLRADIENISNNVYLIAQESAFTRLQYSIPRLVSLTAQLRF